MVTRTADRDAVTPDPSSRNLTSIYETPWEKGYLKDKKLRLVRDADNRIHAQVIAKHLFTKKEGEIVAERIFAPVDPQELEKEIGILAILVQAKASITNMLTKLEADFPAAPHPSSPKADASENSKHINALTKEVEELKEAIRKLNHPEQKSPPQQETLTPTASPQTTEIPTLTSEEIAQRQHEVDELRATLMHLLAEIQSEEQLPNRKGYARLKDIENAALRALAQLQDLQQEVTNPTAPFKNHLQDTAQQIERSKEQWTKELADLRQQQEAAKRRAEIEDGELKNRAENITLSLSTFPEDIQTAWETQYNAWSGENSVPAITMEQVHTRTAKLDVIIASIHAQCKTHIMHHIHIAKNALREEKSQLTNEKLTTNQSTQEAIIKVRQDLLNLRMESWKKLEAEADIDVTNLASLASLKDRVQQEQDLDRVLCTLLTKTHPAYDTKQSSSLYDIATYYSSALIKKITGSTTSDIYSEAEASDAVFADLIDHLLASQLQQQQSSLKLLFEAHATSRTPIFEKLDNYLDATENSHDSLQAFTQDICKKTRSLLTWKADANLHMLRTDWQQGLKATKENLAELELATSKLGLIQDNYVQRIHRYEAALQPNEKTGECSLTGQELNHAKNTLAELQAELDFRPALKNYPLTQDFINAYQKRLEAKAVVFDAYVGEETNKNEQRKKLTKNIDSFIAEIALYRTQITLIEQNYGIALTDVKKILHDVQHKVDAWKHQGPLPTVLLATSFMSKYMLAELPFTQISMPWAPTPVEVNTLNSTALNRYNEYIKELLENESTALIKATKLPDLNVAFDKFNKKMKLVNERVADLKDSRYQQLQRSSLLKKQQEKVVEAQKKSIQSNPTVKHIINTLKNDATQLETLLSNYPKNKKLDPLIQMKQCAPTDIALINELRTLFLDEQKTKIATKKQEMLAQRNQLKEPYLDMQKEADRIIENCDTELAKYKNTFNTYLYTWTSAMTALKNPWIKEKRILDQLDPYQLAAYAETQNTILNKYDNQLNLLMQQHGKTVKAAEELTKTIQQVTSKIKELESSDQLLSAYELKAKLKQYEEAILGKKQPDWYASIRNKIPYKNSYYHRHHAGMGAWITQFKAELERIKDNPRSLPKQLEIVLEKTNPSFLRHSWNVATYYSYGMIANKLSENSIIEPSSQVALDIATLQELSGKIHDRYEQKVSDILSASETKLNEIKQKLNDTISRYVPHDSSLYTNMMHDVKAKLKDIQEKKDKFETTRGIVGYFGGLSNLWRHPIATLNTLLRKPTSIIPSIRPRDLNPLSLAVFSSTKDVKELSGDEMEDYYNTIQKESEEYMLDLEANYHIETIIKNEAGFNSALNIATNEANKLRNRGERFNAFMLRNDLKKIETKLDAWKQSVTSISNLKTLSDVLKKQATAITETSKKATVDLPKRQQIENFMAYTKKTGISTNDEIEALKEDIIKSIKNVIGNTKKEIDKQEKNLKELSDTFNLTLPFDELISKARQSVNTYSQSCPIDTDLRIFIPNLPLLGQLKTKYYDDLTPQQSIEAEKYVNEQSKKDLNAIGDTFGSITTHFEAYNVALKKSIEAQNTLEQQGQFAAAAALKATTEEIKKTYLKPWLKGADETPTWLQSIGQAVVKGAANLLPGDGSITVMLSSLPARLRSLKNNDVQSRKAMDEFATLLKAVADQIASAITLKEIEAKAPVDLLDQLDTVDATEAVKVRAALKKELEKDIETKTEALNKYEETINALAEISFPAPWRQAVLQEIKQCRDELVGQSIGFTVDVPRNILAGNFQTTKLKTLDDLTPEEYVAYKQQRLKVFEKIAKLDKDYCLTTLKKQYESYKTYVENANKELITYKNNLQLEHVKQLSEGLKAFQKQLSSHFQVNLDARQGAAALSEKLTDVTSQIAVLISSTVSKPVVSFADLFRIVHDKVITALGGQPRTEDTKELLAILSKSKDKKIQTTYFELRKEHADLRKTIVKEVNAKLAKAQKSLEECEARIKKIPGYMQTLNEQSAKLLTNVQIPGTISFEWTKSMLGELEKFQTEITKDIATAQESLSDQQLVDLEATLKARHEEHQIDETRSTLFLSEFEKAATLARLAKGLKTYQEIHVKVHAACEDPLLTKANTKESLKNLRIIQATYNELVVKALKNLFTLNDNRECCNTVAAITHALAKAYDKFKKQQPIVIEDHEGWTAIRDLEQKADLPVDQLDNAFATRKTPIITNINDNIDQVIKWFKQQQEMFELTHVRDVLLQKMATTDGSIQFYETEKNDIVKAITTCQAEIKQLRINGKDLTGNMVADVPLRIDILNADIDTHKLRLTNIENLLKSAKSAKAALPIFNNFILKNQTKDIFAKFEKLLQWLKLDCAPLQPPTQYNATDPQGMAVILVKKIFESPDIQTVNDTQEGAELEIAAQELAQGHEFSDEVKQNIRRNELAALNDSQRVVDNIKQYKNLINYRDLIQCVWNNFRGEYIKLLTKELNFEGHQEFFAQELEQFITTFPAADVAALTTQIESLPMMQGLTGDALNQKVANFKKQSLQDFLTNFYGKIKW